MRPRYGVTTHDRRTAACHLVDLPYGSRGAQCDDEPAMTAPRQRTARSGAGLRMLRAAVFAAVCVVLAAAGHALASCATVPLWTLGAGFLGVFARRGAARRTRTRSLPGIAALLAVGQTVLHTLFGLGQHATSATGPGSATDADADASLVARAARLVCGGRARRSARAQAQQILADARISAATAATSAGMDMGSMHHRRTPSAAAGSPTALLPSLPMLLGHVLAAVAAGWLLRRGDLALLRLMRLSAHGVAEGALVRSLRGALALVRALRAGLPGRPGSRRTPRARGCSRPPPRRPPRSSTR